MTYNFLQNVLLTWTSLVFLNLLSLATFLYNYQNSHYKNVHGNYYTTKVPVTTSSNDNVQNQTSVESTKVYHEQTNLQQWKQRIIKHGLGKWLQPYMRTHGLVKLLTYVMGGITFLVPLLCFGLVSNQSGILSGVQFLFVFLVRSTLGLVNIVTLVRHFRDYDFTVVHKLVLVCTPRSIDTNLANVLVEKGSFFSALFLCHTFVDGVFFMVLPEQLHQGYGDIMGNNIMNILTSLHFGSRLIKFSVFLFSIWLAKIQYEIYFPTHLHEKLSSNGVRLWKWFVPRRVRWHLKRLRYAFYTDVSSFAERCKEKVGFDLDALVAKATRARGDYLERHVCKVCYRSTVIDEMIKLKSCRHEVCRRCLYVHLKQLARFEAIQDDTEVATAIKLFRLDCPLEGSEEEEEIDLHETGGAGLGKTGRQSILPPEPFFYQDEQEDLGTKHTCAPLKFNFIQKFLESSPSLKKKSQAILEALDKKLLINSLSRMKDLMFCPNSTCDNAEFSKRPFDEIVFLRPKSRARSSVFNNTLLQRPLSLGRDKKAATKGDQKDQRDRSNTKGSTSALPSLFRKAKASTEGSSFFLRKKASHGRFKTTGGKDGRDLRIFKCKSCGTNSCVLCNKYWYKSSGITHDDMTCEAFASVLDVDELSL